MPSKLSQFWQELKRRNVVKVLAWYAGIGFVIIELFNNVSEPLNFPEWSPRLAILLVIVGVPVAAILSWIFDFTPEGLQRTDPLEPKRFRNDPSYADSIAVLPFQDMSPEKDQEYFCDGIAEEIINALTRVENLKVIARTSAFAFKGKQMDIREIGNTLNVEIVLEGSVRKDSNTLRITAQLIRVDDGSHIWSEAFSRELKDIFSIQEEISLTIVKKLEVKLGKENKEVLLKRHTENHEAYQLYLQGFYHWQKMTPQGNQKAQEYYLKAVEKDPEYALVYSILGSNFGFAGLLGFIPPDVSVQNGLKYTNKALEIDDSISVAHSTLGAYSMLHDWDLEAAKSGFLRSVQLNPNSSWDRFFYSLYLRYKHQYEEAIAESLFAIEKDPFNIYLCTEVGITYLMAGRVQDAIERQKMTITINPEGFMAHHNLAEAYEVNGQLDDAIAYYDKAVKLSGGHSMSQARYACSLHKTGSKEEAREIIEKVEQMKETMYIPSSFFVPYYLLVKNFDQAYFWLKRACEERDFNLPALMNTQVTEYRMPDDPRFNALLEETGLNKYME